MTATETSYAAGRQICDADSHLMELPDWLTDYADPDIRDRIRPLELGGAGTLAKEAVEPRRGSPGRRVRRPEARSGAADEEGLACPRRLRSG